MSVEDFQARSRHRRRDKRVKTCRHFNGIQHDTCGAGVRYRDLTGYVPGGIAERSLPCLPPPHNLPLAACPYLAFKTAEEIEAEEKAWERSVDLLRRGLSPCCEAPLDVSHVIERGRHKGHGPRFCSKCRQLCMMV